MTTQVLHLSTGQVITFVDITPEQAVICAFAQWRGDWNTWGYDQYAALVVRGSDVVTLGDFSAYTDGRQLSAQF